MPERIPQSTAVRIALKAYLSSDHVSVATGKTIAVVISKNGAAFGNPHAGATNATEIANGWYYVDLDSTDTATAGPLIVRGTCAGVDDVECIRRVVDAHNAGFDGVPSATAGATGGLPLSVDASGRVDVLKINGTGQTARDLGGTLGAAGAGLSAIPDLAGVTTLLARITAARAGYFDNLNIGGAVASHADVLAINTSTSKHILLTTVGQYERPESGSTVYTVEARTYSAADGSAVNADTTPTLTATGQSSGSLAANLSAATNPATGVYRWTYTVQNNATAEPIRFDVSATISSATFTLSAYTQVVDEVSQTWTSTDASHLTAIFNKLPANNIADETLLLAAIAGIPAAPTAAQNAAAMLDLADGVEVGLTPRQCLRLTAAALAGKISGAATTTIVIRNAVADSKNRITATVDSSGNRSAITTDVT